MTYNVFGETLNLAQSVSQANLVIRSFFVDDCRMFNCLMFGVHCSSLVEDEAMCSLSL